MKKYTLIFIPVILILIYLYSTMIVRAQDGCDTGYISTITRDHKLNPAMNCPCGTYTSVTFDDEQTPDKIDAGSGVTVYIKDGCPPFTFEVSEQGYTWSTSGTTTYQTNSRSIWLKCDPGT